MSAELAQPLSRPRRAAIAPRVVRGKDAPGYLGMCRDVFDQTVRPYIREFPIGERGVGFDREELDAWLDAYIEQAAIAKAGATGQQSARSERQKGETSWREKPSRASRKGTGSGTSTRKSTENDFTKALALVTGRKPKST
jgi:predicted DNA-binding transcriptional regulator AlpA